MTKPEDRCKDRIFTIPNLLSFFRLCLIPFIVWQYAVRQNFSAALLLLVLSGLTDIADGFIARKFNMISDFGKALDPVADKLTQIALLLCKVARFPNMWLPLVLLVVKEIFAGICGLLLLRRGMIMGADWHGKLTTVLLYATILVHILWIDITPAVSNILIALCTAVLILSGTLYAVRNLRALRLGGSKCEKS